MQRFKFIVVRIDKNVTVLFEDNFINGKPFETQNKINEVLSLLYERERFDVNLMTHISKEEIK